MTSATPTQAPKESNNSSTIKILSSSQVGQVLSHVSLPELLLSQGKAFLAISKPSEPADDAQDQDGETQVGYECPQRIALTSSPWFTQLFMPSRTNSSTNTGDKDADSVIKMVSVPKPTATNIPKEVATGGIQGTNIQISAQTGRAEVMLNSTQLTPLRNAAGSLLSSIVCIPTNAAPSIATSDPNSDSTRNDTRGLNNVVVFGDGQQSVFHVWMHLRYFYTIRDITIVVGSHRPTMEQGEVEAKRSKFVHSLQTLFDHYTPASEKEKDGGRMKRHLEGVLERICVVHPALHEEVFKQKLGQAELLITCTPSTQPLFKTADIIGSTSKDVHIVAIGSYKPTMCELPPELVDSVSHQGILMVDSVSACQEEAGCLLQANSKPNQWTELGSLLPPIPDPSPNGSPLDIADSWLRNLQECYHQNHSNSNNTNDNPSKGKITIFKSVGVGLQDTEITKLVTRYAHHLNMGTHVPF